MARDGVDQESGEMARIFDDYPQLKKYVELYRSIRQVQERVRGDPFRGTTLDWSDVATVSKLAAEALRHKKPVVNFISSSIFASVSLSSVLGEIVVLLVKNQLCDEGLARVASEKKGAERLVLSLTGASWTRDFQALKKLGGDLGVSPTVVLLLGDALIQPALEAIVKTVDPAIFQSWWRVECPVCGRKPQIAHLRKGKRYLDCGLCGVEYLVDLFVCVNCRNTDPNTLGFLTVKNKPGFRIDFCRKCKHYIKVVVDDVVQGLPGRLEDLLTPDLDRIAENASYVRDAE